MDTTDEAPLHVVALGTGDVQVRLTWTGPADLDIHVVDPEFCEIYYGQTECEGSGGQLDQDDIPPCPGDASAVWTENIFFPQGAAPEGDYTATARAYNACDVSTDWTMTIWVDGVMVYEIQGSFDADDQFQEQAFSVPTPA